MASEWNAEAAANALLNSCDGWLPEALILAALRAAYEAGARESAEVAVAEAYRCGHEAGRKAGAEEMRERAAAVCDDIESPYVGGAGLAIHDVVTLQCADAIRALPTSPEASDGE